MRRPLTCLAVFAVFVGLLPGLPADASAGWTTVAQDNFSRSLSKGWGTAQRGGSYTFTPTGASTKVSSGRGVAVLHQGDVLLGGLSSLSVTDTDVKVTTTLTRHTSDEAQYALLARRQSDGSSYSTRVRVTGSGQATLALHRSDAKGSTWLAGMTLPFTVPSGKAVQVQLHVTGTGPVALAARAWRGTKVPTWQVRYTDTSGALTRAGGVALRDSVQKAGKSMTFSHDNFAATANLAAAAPPTSLPTVPPGDSLPSLPLPFVHPGIVNSQLRLEFVKTMIKQGREPWTSALNDAVHSYLAHLDRVPKAVEYVRCGAYNNPDLGCSDEVADAQAAYTDALIWYFTDNQAYADTSIRILNAWSAKLKDHPFDTKQYTNGLLQAGWSGEVFTKAAELIRYSDAGWSDSDIARFETMLDTAFLPRVRNGWTYCCSNWQVSMAEATMNIGVFTNDRSVFEDGLGDWRNHTRASIYLYSDGPTPNLPEHTIVTAKNLANYWFNPTHYVEGEEAETCRDLGHTVMALGAIVNAAETAQIQGIDLYGEEQDRIVAGMEYNATYINNENAAGWPCHAKPDTAGGRAGEYTFDMGYSHYTALGVSMPETKKRLERSRNTRSSLHMNWETLTHALGPL